MLMNHVKLVIENSPEEKALVLEETEGTTVESLIRLAISKAKWKDRRLTLLTAKLYIAEATQFNAITQPLNDMAVSHLQKFEIRLRDEEIATTCSINVDVTINGTTQANQQFELSDNANVQDLIMAILDKIRRNEGNSMIDSVRIFYSEFDEWADVIEPYSNEAIKFDRKYSVVINCKEPEIPPNANSSEKSDQVNSPRTFVMSNSSPAAESGQRDMAHTKPSPTQSSIAIASNQSDLTFAQ
ncbi:hypothetical protein WR25_24792 [Diploscapter pachys]|uniref:Uncharacterized protein n=1 Tax=Diploscapter pachys TaxID=2018661 RepID=A0A2A2M4A5_9BILA|nr:hypothetical protein WR25_24792 [Diploscapter pachys]